jgi:hypothetical protein
VARAALLRLGTPLACSSAAHVLPQHGGGTSSGVLLPLLLTVLVAEQMDRWILPVSGGGTLVICSIFVNPSLVSSVLVREGVLWSSKEIFDGSV